MEKQSIDISKGQSLHFCGFLAPVAGLYTMLVQWPEASLTSISNSVSLAEFRFGAVPLVRVAEGYSFSIVTCFPLKTKTSDTEAKWIYWLVGKKGSALSRRIPWTPPAVQKALGLRMKNKDISWGCLVSTLFALSLFLRLRTLASFQCLLKNA